MNNPKPGIFLALFKIGLFLLPANLINAQQYKPFFDSGYTHYSNSGDGGILSLKLSNPTISGTDTLYDFNHYSRKLYSSSGYVCMYTPYGYTIYYRGASEPLFGQKMLATSTGDFKFIDPGVDTLTLKPYHPTGEKWEYSSAYSDSAHITLRTVQTILGLSDSVIHIQLPGGTTLQLSEHFGIIQSREVFPEAPLKEWQIYRSEKGKAGTEIPGFNDYFNFDVDDRFVRAYRYADYYTDEVTFTELSVLSKMANIDSTRFEYEMQRRRVKVNYYLSYDTTFYAMDTITEVHEESDYPRLDMYWRERDGTSGNITEFHGTDPLQFNGRHQLQQYRYLVDHCAPYGDTTMNELLLRTTYSGFTNDYVVGVGPSYYGVSVYGDKMWLECYEKGSESWGDCMDALFDSAPVALEENIEQDIAFRFIQNGTSIRIETADLAAKEDMEIRLIDLNGRMLFTSTFNKGEAGIDIPTTQLANGIYFIRATSTEFLVNKRILILR